MLVARHGPRDNESEHRRSRRLILSAFKLDPDPYHPFHGRTSKAAGMSSLVQSVSQEWSIADLNERFGPILYRRICHDPLPGTATEEDVVRLMEKEGRLYELVDGVLVEKVMGSPESLLAMLLGHYLNSFVLPRKSGFVLGPDGMWRLRGGLIRLPDVAFIARDDAPNGKFPKGAMIDIVPRLSVEILSPSNTRREMEEKLDDYFNAGVRLVWFIDPSSLTAQVFTARDAMTTLDQSQSLTGGDVLPGFELSLRTLFEDLNDA